MGGWLAYRTSKMIRIDYWQLGLLYYVLCAGATLAYTWSVLQSGEYLLKESVRGRVPPYVERSKHPMHACVDAGDCAAVRAAQLNADYCSSPNHTYHYDRDFLYASGPDLSVGPECQNVDVYGVSDKGTNRISFTTLYMEWQHYGWPCSEASGAFATKAIAACNEAPAVTDGQCECYSSKAVFPAAIEYHSIGIMHSFEAKIYSTSWRGDSSFEVAEPEKGYPHLLHTDVLFAHNGTSRTYQAGEMISLTLKETLEMVGMDLNDINPNVSPDYRSDPDAYGGVDFDPSVPSTPVATNRNIGLELTVKMNYTNRHAGEVMVLGGIDKRVDVTLTVELESGSWTSTGPKTYYPVYPEGPLGDQTFHRVTRYPQDVIINFVDEGYVYAFDPMAFLDAIVRLTVAFGLVRLIMDAVTFYMIPNVSLVLRNKRAETTTRKLAFQELGMKAAISVSQFKALDSDGDGRLNLKELVRVFGSVENVDRKRAMMIAKTILGRETDDDGSISFAEFMSMTEGEAITFDHYLRLVRQTGGNLSLFSLQARESAMQAYDEVEKGIALEQEERRASVAGGGASPLAPIAARPSQVAPTHACTPTMPTPALPPGVIKLMCHQCRRAFGVPAGANMVSCPHCKAVNQVAVA